MTPHKQSLTKCSNCLSALRPHWSKHFILFGPPLFLNLFIQPFNYSIHKRSFPTLPRATLEFVMKLRQRRLRRPLQGPAPPPSSSTPEEEDVPIIPPKENNVIIPQPAAPTPESQPPIRLRIRSENKVTTTHPPNWSIEKVDGDWQKLSFRRWQKSVYFVDPCRVKRYFKSSISPPEAPQIIPPPIQETIMEQQNQPQELEKIVQVSLKSDNKIEEIEKNDVNPAILMEIDQQVPGPSGRKIKGSDHISKKNKVLASSPSKKNKKKKVKHSLRIKFFKKQIQKQVQDLDKAPANLQKNDSPKIDLPEPEQVPTTLAPAPLPPPQNQVVQQITVRRRNRFQNDPDWLSELQAEWSPVPGRGMKARDEVEDAMKVDMDVLIVSVDPEEELKMPSPFTTV